MSVLRPGIAHGVVSVPDVNPQPSPLPGAAPALSAHRVDYLIGMLALMQTEC